MPEPRGVRLNYHATLALLQITTDIKEIINNNNNNNNNNLNANFHRLLRSRCYFVVLRCRWFCTKVASVCPLLEIIDRVYPLKFTGPGTLNMY